MVEIELKTRISDPEGVKRRLSGLGIYDCAYEKDDAYWFPHDDPAASLPPSGVRVRRETNTAADGKISQSSLVTYKIRELRAGIEVNDEREFTVSDGEVFEDLLRRLGLAPGIKKNKRGWAWRLTVPADQGPDIRAELSEVQRLGWFLELEILAPERNEKTIAQCREKLLGTLEKLEIPQGNIEPRPYTEMLKALG
ncbi:MAG: CYTH domain-containing protein [Spirochaetaceae bacterium]|jgi:adenylate cyclase class 2|nr:CYTH domain-containing protein [Spirochaetaceae bacterium]